MVSERFEDEEALLSVAVIFRDGRKFANSVRYTSNNCRGGHRYCLSESSRHYVQRFGARPRLVKVLAMSKACYGFDRW
jgi:hypothetical protein